MKTFSRMLNRIIAPIQIVLVLAVSALTAADKTISYIDLSSKQGFRLVMLVMGVVITIIGISQIVFGLISSSGKIRKSLPSVLAGFLALVVWLQFGNIYWVTMATWLIKLLTWSYFSIEIFIILCEVVIIVRGR